ncbi:MAG: dTDP-4-amino-4,6-dideoxygalactose transaminase [Angelakisella sp.]
MVELDCLGDMCPVPVMKLQECTRLQNAGESVKLITDHSCTVESVRNFCQTHKLLLAVVEPINGIWELTVTKPESSVTAPEAGVPFYARYHAEDEAAYMTECLAGSLSSEGDFSRRAGDLYRELTGTEHILFTPSCSAALELGLRSVGFSSGDEIIVPSYNFPSAANAVLAVGATPVFCDVDEATQNISPESFAAAITSRTKAVIPVHYAGVAADMQRILKISEQAGLLVMEDAAQCVDATWNKKPLGTIGNLGAVSFHATKNVTCGEGGALILRDGQLWEQARICRMHGTDRDRFLHGECDRYTWQDGGSCYILSEPSSCLLYTQLSHVNEITGKRLQIAKSYDQALQELEQKGVLQRMQVPAYAGYNGHLYYILLENQSWRDGAMAHLADAGIDAKTHYVPLHASPMGERLGYRENSLPNSMRTYQTLLRLPIHTQMSPSAAFHIAEILSDYL